MKQVYFCRHGLSQLGKQGLWAGSTDTPLADEGRGQAEQAGREAKKLNIDYIIASPLVRAHDTALIIASQIGYPVESIEINKLVVERDFGELEGTAWNPDFDLESLASIEPVESLLKRARETYEYLQTLSAQNILVVSHGSFGRALRHVINPDIPFDNKNRLENAKVVQFL